MSERVCKYCGKSIAYKSVQAKFCGNTCKQRYYYNTHCKDFKAVAEQKQCFVCNAFFIPLTRRQLCCSRACSTIYKRDKKRSKKQVYTKICSACGKEFSTTSKIKKTCSVLCSRQNTRNRDKALRQSRRQVYTKICPVCGKDFRTSAKRRKTCSALCSRQYKNYRQKEVWLCKRQVYTKICSVCGKEFTTSVKRRKTCSVPCSEQNDRNREKALRQSKQQVYTKICSVCGKEFTTTSRIRKTCSAHCSCKSAIRHKEEVQLSERQIYTKICLTCGNKFTTASKRKKYCSLECGPNKKIYYRECVICGNAFSTVKSKVTTCSQICSCIRRSKEKMEKSSIKNFDSHFLVKKRGDLLCCPVCNTYFLPTRSNQIVCSHECRKKYASIRNVFLRLQLRLTEDTIFHSDVDHCVNDSILHGECPYLLGYLRSDAMYLPVF